MVAPCLARSFGPLRVDVRASGAEAACVGELLRGVAFSEERIERAVATPTEVEVVMSTVSGSRRGLPRVPHFSRRAGEEGLFDASEGWEARFLAGREGVSCEFGLVDVEAFETPWRERLRELNVAAALRVALGLAAPHAGGLLLHGAALSEPLRGGAMVFLGPSGEGKSTMASRLPGWRLLADDAVLVWCEREPGEGFEARGRWFATGTMLPGKERLPRFVTRAPLGAVVALEKGAAELSLLRRTPGAALTAILQRVLYFADPDERIFGLVERLAREVAFASLASSLHHEVEPLLRELAGRSEVMAPGLGGAA